MAEIILTKDNFEEEVMKSDVPVLIDFSATWCGPCQMIAPKIEEIAREREGTLKVCKCDVDDEPEIANSFKVASIPMLFVVKNGEVTSSAVGYRTKEQIEALL